MSRPALLPLYINGRFEEEGQRFDNISPVDGRLLNQAVEADAAQVARAVQAASNALQGPWGRYSAPERAALLHKVADGIQARFDDFVAAEVADTGRPLHLARTLDLPRAIANFRTFADLAVAQVGDCCETPQADGGLLFNYTVRKPLGVVAVIAPWNLPLLLLTWKLGPALAMGNTVVCKPSEETPSSAALLAEVMDAAGVPAGVFNLVHGFGPGSAGEHLTRAPQISAVSFTGESRTGSAIMKAVADGVKDISFELGGKNAAVVFADADFDAAVAGVARSSFFNTGQVCLCTERVYVERPIFDRFVAALKTRAEGLKLGYPDEDGVDLGPLVSRQHREKVLSYFALAREEGAVVVSGGETPQFGDARDQGAYVRPTIWTGLPDHARCVREEIFGPVCHIAPFDDDEEILRRVNDSPYGLACALWTQRLDRAHRLARRVQVGIVWVNAWYARDLRTPFGGSKLSGLGREGGRHSLDFYSDISNVCVKL